MTSKLTREWLQHQISEIEGAGINNRNTLAALKLALATMDGKPTAWKLEGGGAPDHVTLDERVAHADPLRKVTPLYEHAKPVPDGWQIEAEKLAEKYGMSFVLFCHGEQPQCADPTKVVISFTDKGLGHDKLPPAPQEVK